MSDRTPPPDPNACEREPIHAPGSIQPHGVLLVLEPDGLTVSHVSENCRVALGEGPAGVLGRPASALLGPDAGEALRQCLAQDDPSNLWPIPLALSGAGGGGWEGEAHRLGHSVFVELEPASPSAGPPLAVLGALRGAVGRLTAASTTGELFSVAAREVRGLTGYDRVMVYRFDDEWNGRVAAEDRRRDVEPYLGLHYPASDIPAQARALYLTNRLRVIPDAAYQPVKVVPPEAGEPLDLGGCLLRGVSPVHCEYVQNMGVRATLSASLVVGGRLWGLIACHHLTPLLPPRAVREACVLLAQMISAQLGFLADAEDKAYRAALWEVLGRIGAQTSQTIPAVAGLLQHPANLLAWNGVTGAAVWRSGKVISIGRVPPGDALSGLVEWVKRSPGPVVATDRLASHYPPAAPFADMASGLLAVELSRDPDEYILWFRPEVLQTIDWGGDPAKAVNADGPGGRPSPRKSFALWKETVRGRSFPWRPKEVEAAGRLRDLVLAAGSKSASRLEALLPICAWCKKVRDEPGYWRKVEDFVRDHVDVRFTHGMCPNCLDEQLKEFRHSPPAG